MRRMPDFLALFAIFSSRIHIFRQNADKLQKSGQIQDFHQISEKSEISGHFIFFRFTTSILGQI